MDRAIRRPNQTAKTKDNPRAPTPSPATVQSQRLYGSCTTESGTPTADRQPDSFERA